MKKKIFHFMVIMLIVSFALLLSCNLNGEKNETELPPANFSILNGYRYVRFCGGIWINDAVESETLFNWESDNDRDNSQSYYMKPGIYNFWFLYPSPIDVSFGYFADSNNEIIEFEIKPDCKYELILYSKIFYPLVLFWELKEIGLNQTNYYKGKIEE